MSRRRRALLLAGLAIVLGGLAASNVAGREAALSRRIGRLVDVVVARERIAAGSTVRAAALAVRRVPARFAPEERVSSPSELTGQKAAVDIDRGTDMTARLVGDPSAGPAGLVIGRGERIAQLVALGSPQLVTPGSRVDVLVTPEPRSDEAGEAVLALEDVEVLDAAPADATPARGQAARGERVAVSLRVTLRQAVYLAAAQDFARELRVLPRADGDRRRGSAGLRMGALVP
ncbi:MAG: pilus assembly protein CpaB [bacterium]|jgi:pilus assembly protein CpaB